jgi:threonine dehydrogenase-like Zn-dependent dehydrogenase
MRALIFEGPHRLAVRDVFEPEPGPADVLIALEAVGICGSDVHGYAGETGRRRPGMTMGHEICGRIVALGASAGGPAIGSLVTINPVIGCGRCDLCARVETNLCAGRSVIGVDATYRGAFSELMAAPAANAAIVSDLGGALAEPLAVGIHAASVGGSLAGVRVAVIGCGMIGLAAVWAAVQTGASEVVASDLDGYKVRLASRLGARAEGSGPADVVIDAVGISATIKRALQVVRRGGTVVVVGMGAPTVELPAFEIVTEERTLVGSFCYSTSDFAAAVAAVGSGAFPWRYFVDREAELEEAPAIFASLARGEAGTVKTLVRPGRG